MYLAGALLCWFCVVNNVAAQTSLESIPHRRVCTSPYWPLADCNSDNMTGGYEIELFRLAAKIAADNGHQEWAPGNWSFVCIDEWDSMLQSLLDPPETRACDVVVAGVSATVDRKGTSSQPGPYKFSYATYRAGRRIMMYHGTKYDIWWWTQHLEPKLWLLFFGTAAVMGIAILLAELPWNSAWQQPQAMLAKASNLQWASAALLVGGGPHLTPRSPGGRIMLLAFGFLVMIVMNLYIAAAAATMLIVATKREQVNDLNDLVNLRVGIFVDDNQEFKRFALNDVVLYAWANQPDEDIMMAQLRSGYVDALVLDAPWVEFMIGTQCDMYSVGDLVLPVDMGFAYASNTPDSDLAVLDGALARLDDSGIMAQLDRDIIRSGQMCTSASTNQLSMVIKLQHVAGLWVILAAAVCLGFGWNLAVWLLRGWQARRALHDSQSASSVHSGKRRASLEDSQTGKSGSSPGLPVANTAASAEEGCLGGGCAPLFGPSPPGASVSDSWVSLADASTVDEAVQVVDARLRHVSNHIKHLPWIISAVMDSKLGSLRQELLSATAAAAAGGVPGGVVQAQASKTRASTQSHYRQPMTTGPASIPSGGQVAGMGSQDSNLGGGLPTVLGSQMAFQLASGGSHRGMEGPATGSQAAASDVQAPVQQQMPEVPQATRSEFVQRAAKRFGLMPDDSGHPNGAH